MKIKFLLQKNYITPETLKKKQTKKIIQHIHKKTLIKTIQLFSRYKTPNQTVGSQLKNYLGIFFVITFVNLF